MLQTIFLCCSSSSGHWRVLQTYYQCMDVNAKISQNSLFKYRYFSTSHTIQFITVKRYLKVWEILLGTEHVIITLWQMSETIPGFVCLFVLLLLLNSTSFVFTDDFSAVILSKIECILTDTVTVWGAAISPWALRTVTPQLCSALFSSKLHPGVSHWNESRVGYLHLDLHIVIQELKCLYFMWSWNVCTINKSSAYL